MENTKEAIRNYSLLIQRIEEIQKMGYVEWALVEKAPFALFLNYSVLDISHEWEISFDAEGSLSFTPLTGAKEGLPIFKQVLDWEIWPEILYFLESWLLDHAQGEFMENLTWRKNAKEEREK